MRILAISGSLRAGSSNTALLRAASVLAPETVEVIVYGGLADLPHFNPDLDNGAVPPPVRDFRAQLRASDGVLISSPEYAHGVPGALKNALDWVVEYAHGVPGALKNALDWVVGSGELYGKPVAFINASSRSAHAQASLMETLTVMTAIVIPEASITLSLRSNKLDQAGILLDPEISGAMRASVLALARAIDSRRIYASVNNDNEHAAS